MAIRQGFFNSPDSQAPDRLYFAENWNDINDITFGDGFSLKKTPDQTFVKFNPAGVGEILIDIIDFAALLRGYYYTQESETIQKSLPLATLDRIDLIVLRLQGNSSASRILSVEVIQGVESGSPVAPPINVGVGDIWDLVLAQVFVTGGQATLPNGQSDITMVVAKMELAGFAAEATKAFQDENARNLASNLKYNTYNLLTDLGITDSDFNGLTEIQGIALIASSLPQFSVLRMQTAGLSDFESSVMPETNGVFTAQRDVDSNKIIVQSDTLVSNAAAGGIKRYIGQYNGAFGTDADRWDGWKKLLNNEDKAADSFLFDGKTNQEYTKRGNLFISSSIPTGWRRIVEFKSGNGRGNWLINIKTSGGAASPKGATMIIQTDSGAATTGLFDIINVIASNVSGVTPFDKLRITQTGGFKYLEMNNLTASAYSFVISVMPLYDEDLNPDTAYEILNPTTTIGDGTTVANTDLNNGEIDLDEIIANFAEKFKVGKAGNTASGILLEDFGSGLAVTTDTSSVNATVITTKADKEIYSSIMLLVGGTNNQRRFIEIELDTFTQTSQAYNFTQSPTIGTDVFDDFQAKIFVDQPANQIEAYEARQRNWNGISSSNAIDVASSSLRIFKVWGIKR